MREQGPTEFGDYVLRERIGAGGMAEIFLASQQGIEGFEKRLVIKRILPTLSDDEQFVRMFIEEAKLCVALRHRNIVQVYDLGEIEQQYFIAMEYVDGRDLLKTLAACGRKKIGFPTDIALFIVMEVLKGLEHAHRLKSSDGRPLGIIHRDVSPSNVLLSFDGEVKIGDFGIAKATTREKTATGILKGKFGYMAPEQVTGAPIDHRADIFAVGILLYELLTGHRLFAGKNDLAVLERVRDAVIEPPPRKYRPDLDARLEAIVHRALARRPDERFQSASELHDALYDYVFQARALVGAPQLSRFLRGLFPAEADEQVLRPRARPVAEPRLPPSRALEAGTEEVVLEAAGASARAAAVSPRDGSEFTIRTSVSEVVDLRSAVLEPRPPEPAARAPAPMAPSLALELEAAANTLPRAPLERSTLDELAPEEDTRGGERPLLASAGRPGTPLRSRAESPTLNGRGPKSGPLPLPRVSSPPRAPSTIATDIRNTGEGLRAELKDATRGGPAAPTEATGIGIVRAFSLPTLQEEPPRANALLARAPSLGGSPWSLVERPLFPGGSSVPDDAAPVEESDLPTSEVDARELALEGSAPRADTLPADEAQRGAERSPWAGEPKPLSGAAPDDFEEDGETGLVEAPFERSPVSASEVGRGAATLTSAPSFGRGDEPPFDGEEDSLLLTSPLPVEEPEASAFAWEVSVGSQEEIFGLEASWAVRAAEDLRAAEDRARAASAIAAPDRAPTVGDDPAQAAPSSASGAPTSGDGHDESALDEAQDESGPPRRAAGARRPRPVLVPAPSAPDPRPQPPPRAASLGGRRRMTAQSALAVVNPRAVSRVSVRAAPAIEAVVQDAAPLESAGLEEDTARDPASAARVSVRLESGISAALFEAARIDEEIAILRNTPERGTRLPDPSRAAGPRDRTALGELASEAVSDPRSFDAPTAGIPARAALEAPRAVRLDASFSEDLAESAETARGPGGRRPAAAPRASAQRGFAEEEELSVPAITNAGQLDGDDALDLFGVLSMLDERPATSFGRLDEEVSMETESRDLGALLGRPDGGRARDATTGHGHLLDHGAHDGDDLDESASGGVEQGATRWGILAPDASSSVEGAPRPAREHARREVQAELDLGLSSDASTSPVAEEELLAARWAEPSDAAPDLDPLGATRQEPDDEPGLSLSRLDEPPGGHELERMRSAMFGEREEETQAADEGTEEAYVGGPAPRGRPAELEVLGPAQLMDLDATGDSRPREAMLISESFDLGLEPRGGKRVEPPRAEPRARAKSALAPVYPVDLRPMRDESTESELSEVPGAAPSPARSDERGMKKLRAVVERTRPAKEVVRAGAPATTRPLLQEGPAFAPPSGPAQGSFHSQAPGAMLPSLSGERRARRWAIASYVLVALAVVLAVAAAVSSVLLRGIAPIAPLPAEATAPAGPGGEPAAPAPPARPEEAAVVPANEGAPSPEPVADRQDAKGAAPVSAAAASEASAPRDRPARAPRTRARSAASGSERPRSAEPGGPGFLRLNCREALDLKISEVGTLENQTKLKHPLPPGEYQVKLYRDGKKLSQLNVKLLPGQGVDLPCP
jgi:hypothetical protein